MFNMNRGSSFADEMITVEVSAHFVSPGGGEGCEAKAKARTERGKGVESSIRK